MAQQYMKRNSGMIYGIEMDGRKNNRPGKEAVKNSVRRRKKKQYHNLCKLMSLIIMHEDFWGRKDRGNYACKLMNNDGIKVGVRMVWKYLKMLGINRRQEELSEKNYTKLHKIKQKLWENISR